MGSSQDEDEKGPDYSPLPQSELDHPLSRPSSSSSSDDDSYSSSDQETGDYEKGDANDYKFSSLPQSEEEDIDDHHHHPIIEDDGDHAVSIISVESTRARLNGEDYNYTEEALERVNTDPARTTEMIQDLLGLTILLMLIFSPLYRRMGSPSEDPIPPLFTLNSLYVSNFSTTNGILTATWDAKLTVVNLNVSSIYFRLTDFTIFYKHNPEDALSFASLFPFYLDKGESLKLHLKFTTGGGAWDDSEPCVQKWLVEEIQKERERDESVMFGMQVNVEAIYYGDTWVSDVEMSPHCEGLKVQFVPHKGSARLTQPNRNFTVPIGWKPFSLF